MNRNNLINLIDSQMPSAMPTPSEEFDGRKGAIWFRGSEYDAGDGRTVMDMHEFANSFGVHPKLEILLETNGWYGEAYDAGTLMAYKE